MADTEVGQGATNVGLLKVIGGAVIGFGDC